MAEEIPPVVKLLRAERIRQGLSQREITRRLGTSSATLSVWERGLNSPTLSHLFAWARALGMELKIVLEWGDQ